MRIKSRFIVYGFLLLCGLLISRMGHALEAPWKSSTTATADSTATLCGQVTLNTSTTAITVPMQGWIHEIMIDSPTVGSSIQLYDSSWTVISATSSLVIGPISTNAMAAPFMVDSVFRNGLSYVKVGTAIITILYACF